MKRLKHPVKWKGEGMSEVGLYSFGWICIVNRKCERCISVLRVLPSNAQNMINPGLWFDWIVEKTKIESKDRIKQSIC